MTRTSTLIDLTYLRDVSAGDQKMFEEIVTAYVTEMKDNVERLETTAKEEDWQGLLRAAHTLSGSAASLGADRVRAGSVRLEGLLRRAVQPETTRLLIDVIKQEHRRVQELLANDGLQGLFDAAPLD